MNSKKIHYWVVFKYLDINMTLNVDKVLLLVK